ncbi:MAG TPA: hypothetical protein VFE59_40785 [Trebonia sp.]|nr:hypothetical protein [Trebonia sp.]
MPATEVARRAGHGVAVLLKIYAHCIDGQADTANQHITAALTTPRQSPAPAVKKTMSSGSPARSRRAHPNPWRGCCCGSSTPPERAASPTTSPVLGELLGRPPRTVTDLLTDRTTA